MQREKDFAADHMDLSKELFGGITRRQVHSI
jgi:hypothetical protein